MHDTHKLTLTVIVPTSSLNASTMSIVWRNVEWVENNPIENDREQPDIER